MLKLKGHQIYLRALELEDLDFLYKIENDTEIWEVSETLTPYSKFVLKEYIKNAHRDIYDIRQLRLVICDEDDELKGFIDLYEFDPKNGKVGVGIIVEKESRKKGIAESALEVVTNYCFNVLEVHQVFANVGEDNTASLSLFKKAGFTETGIKKDWIRTVAGYKDEILFQKIKQ
ncbi:GNAT family N-acetyltransferase [Flavobacteriaceae bacterium M23B6Z8]